VSEPPLTGVLPRRGQLRWSMSEAKLLSIVWRYPHPRALARHARDDPVFDGLHRLEADGLVRRERGEYRLTRVGKHELAMARAVSSLIARTLALRPD